jgi:F-type H+-transporting ATPase subunit gamma
MELIASSRIIKAQNQVQASSPYATALYKAVSLAASNARGNHPLLLNKTDGKRSAVLLITADRGLAGAYSANILREGERLTELLKDEQGKTVVPFIVGRKGLGYYKFRNREDWNN